MTDSSEPVPRLFLAPAPYRSQLSPVAASRTPQPSPRGRRPAMAGGGPAAGVEGSHRLAGTASAGGGKKLTFPADAAYDQPFSPSLKTTLSFLFHNTLASPRLSRNLYIFFQKADRLSSIIAKLVHFLPKIPMNYRPFCHERSEGKDVRSD